MLGRAGSSPGSSQERHPPGASGRSQCFEFCAPLVEAPRSYPQFSRQLTNVFARPHPLHGHSLKFPGVSLSLHSASFPRNCAQSCVSLQGFTPRLAHTPLSVVKSKSCQARFPGSSTVEHSAVNRRVASSNLARGAILPLESESVTQHVTTTLCGCNRVQLRTFRLKVQSRSLPLRRPFCETSRPPSTCCIGP